MYTNVCILLGKFFHVLLDYLTHYHEIFATEDIFILMSLQLLVNQSFSLFEGICFKGSLFLYYISAGNYLVFRISRCIKRHWQHNSRWLT